MPVVKGQGMPAYDPRAVKGMGVTYATTPMGADHTAGHTYFSKVDHHLPDGQIAASRNSQTLRAAFDAVNICAFAIGALGPKPDIMIDLVNALYGTTYEPSFINKMGKEILRTERSFNKRAGFTKAHDRLPDFFRTEPLAPFDVSFDVSEEEIECIFDEIEG